MTKPKENKWIDRARFAFSELAQGKEELVMNRENWVISRFRFLIGDREQTIGEMNGYFDEMDANGDGVLTWNEIINFLLKKQGKKLITNAKHIDIKCVNPVDVNNVEKIDYVPNDAIFLEEYDQFITFSENLIIFWDSNTLKCKMKLEIPGTTGICYSKYHHKIILTSHDCKIALMDPETASIEEYALNCGDESIMSTATAICWIPDTKYVLIGDENGKISILSLECTEGQIAVEFIDALDMHSMKVTSIIWVELERAFVSCSEDATIVMFGVNCQTLQTRIISRFKVPRDVKLRSVIYDPVANDIFFATADRYFGRWRPRTSNYKIVDVGDTSVTSMSMMQLSKRKSLIIIITDDKFFWMFKQPEFIMVGCFKMDEYHEDQAATVVLAADSNVYAFGSYISKWNIQLSLTSNPTFARKIANVCVCPSLNTILGMDIEAKMLKWKLSNGEDEGKREVSFGVKVTAFSTDDEGKKCIIGMSDGIAVVMNAQNLLYLSRIDLQMYKGGIIDAVMTKMYGITRILIVAGNQVFLYNQAPDNKLTQVRAFKDNYKTIFKLAVLKHKYVLTCAESDENIIFDLNNRGIKKDIHFPNRITRIADIPTHDRYFLAGDEKGMIHIMSIDQSEPIGSVDVFGCNTPITITAMSSQGRTIAVGNNLGYVKTFHYEHGLIETSRFRAHYGSITNLQVFSETFLCTVGDDRRILLFALSPPRFVGAIGNKRGFDQLAPSTWRNPEDFCQQDMSHFINPNMRIVFTNATNNIHEPSGISAPSAPRRMGHFTPVKPLNIGKVMNMIDALSYDDTPPDTPKAETQRAPHAPTIVGVSRTPRILRPIIRHPGLLPLYHSNGAQTVRIIEDARNLVPTSVNEKLPPLKPL